MKGCPGDGKHEFDNSTCSCFCKKSCAHNQIQNARTCECNGVVHETDMGINIYGATVSWCLSFTSDSELLKAFHSDAFEWGPMHGDDVRAAASDCNGYTECGLIVEPPGGQAVICNAVAGASIDDQHTAIAVAAGELLDAAGLQSGFQFTLVSSPPF